MCTCAESVLLLKDKGYGPVRTFHLHGFLQAPFKEASDRDRQESKGKGKVLAALECVFPLTRAAPVHDSKPSPRSSDLSPADLLPSSPGPASKEPRFGQGTQRNPGFLDASLHLGWKSPKSTFSLKMVGWPQSELEMPSNIQVLVWLCTLVCRAHE